MSVAVGLLAIGFSFVLPTICLILLIWGVVNWTPTPRPEPPQEGDGPGGLRTRAHPPRPHGGPERKPDRRRPAGRRRHRSARPTAVE